MSTFTVAVPILIIVGVVAATALAAMLTGKLFKLVFGFVRHVVTFVVMQVTDALHLAACALAGFLFLLLSGINTVLGRWSDGKHYGKALEKEMMQAGRAIYRLAIASPLRFLGLRDVVDNLERRVPETMAKVRVPEPRPVRVGSREFPGYKVVGTLPTGGSGARLYIARPDKEKRASFAHAGAGRVGYVVLKSFSLADGSALPQIVRESRALEAAKRLGLVLDHDLNEQRFYYAMPYVPGENLRAVASRMHDASGVDGLGGRELQQVMSWACDLLLTLDRYHQGGLWHKDVKPDNIVISEGRAHLVDLGLVTPLRSAMTLTTHGTEYFRDPEMVRMAMRGAKVHEVDGVRFDLYGAGAVLYAALENSFPAHGGLSTITRQCPESLKWIVRRAMAEMHGRYRSAGEMLADLRVVMAASDPCTVRPADLPSVSGKAAPQIGPLAPPEIPQYDLPAAAMVANGVAEPDDAGAVFRADLGAAARQGVGFAAQGVGAAGRGIATAAARVKEHITKRRAERKRRGMFFPVVLVMLVFTGMLAFRFQERRGWEPYATHARDMGLNVDDLGAQWNSFSLNPEKWLPKVEITSTRRSESRPPLFAGIEAWPVNGGSGSHSDESGRLVAGPGIGQEKESGIVLVLEDVPASAEQKSGALSNVYESLNAAGFELLGIGASSLSDEDEIALEAAARGQLGFSEPIGREASHKLAPFFEDFDNQIDAVLWVGRGEQADQLRSFVAFRNGFDPSLLLEHLSQRVD